ncbi:MAG: beta-lactamase family protein [Pseudomonadales bacterium]|nr:beta-lactamase family protein [Pseudomonadales bacterium]
MAQRLEVLVDRLAARRDLPHAVLRVESGEGAVLWSGAAGQAAPDRAMTDDTPFFIASIDKLMTATVVLRLVERGLFALDDPLVRYLDGSSLVGLHRVDGRDRTGQITLRNLLSHTSGLADYLEDAPRGGQSLVEAAFAGADRAVPLDAVVARVRDDLVPHFPPQSGSDPRARVRYSDTNYRLLCAVLEAVSGDSLAELFARELFVPLGMERSWFMGHEGPARAGPAPATVLAGAVPLDRPALLTSLDSVFSTSGDLIRFLRALTRGILFAAPGTWGVMCGEWRRFGLPRDRAALRAPSWPIEYSLGIMRFALPRLFTPLRPLPAVLGHTGSTGTWTFYCPALDVFIAGAVNQATAGAVPFRTIPRILRILGRDRPSPPGRTRPS